MRRRIFNVTAAISLALLAIVVAAIFSSAALTVQSTLQTRIFKLYRGQVEIVTFDYAERSVPMPIQEPPFNFNWDGNWMPGSKAIAGFEAGYAQPQQWNVPSTTAVHYLAFPVWILAVPFLIAPARWLWIWNRKRRESRMDSSTAFPVRIGE